MIDDILAVNVVVQPDGQVTTHVQTGNLSVEEALDRLLKVREAIDAEIEAALKCPLHSHEIDILIRMGNAYNIAKSNGFGHLRAMQAALEEVRKS